MSQHRERPEVEDDLCFLTKARHLFVGSTLAEMQQLRQSSDQDHGNDKLMNTGKLPHFAIGADSDADATVQTGTKGGDCRRLQALNFTPRPRPNDEG